MAVGGLCFSFGGTGWKPARRFIMPVLLGLICLFAGFSWWQSLGLSVTLSIVLHLGYGEKSPYWKKSLIFASYGLATLWLGFSVWQIITPIGCLLLFLGSNTKWSSNAFLWKICEFLMGSLIGITIAHLIFIHVP